MSLVTTASTAVPGVPDGVVQVRVVSLTTTTLVAGLPSKVTTLVPGELAWKPQKTTKFSAFAGHEVGYSLAAAFQRNTWVGGKVEQEIPTLDMGVFAEAVWRVQEPRHVANLRAMYYVIGVGWSRWDELVIGAQATYTKSKSRVSEWEVFTAGLSITLRY